VFEGGAKGKLYFTAGVNSASERQLYSVDLQSKLMTQMSKEKGCHAITFSNTCEFYLDVYSDFTNPPKYAIKSQNGEVNRVLEDNKALSDKLSNIEMGKVVFGNFENDEGFELDFWQIFPPNFDSEKKYPVLFFVYGGLGHQTVMDIWGGANYL